MKGKEEASERMRTEKEASQPSDTEFKAMVIRKLTELTELTENYQKLQGNYNELTANSVSYTHLTLPTMIIRCRSRWSPYH